MKKAYSICILAILPLATALGHSSTVVHMHPHGENDFSTTWLVAAVIGLVVWGVGKVRAVRVQG